MRLFGTRYFTVMKRLFLLVFFFSWKPVSDHLKNENLFFVNSCISDCFWLFDFRIKSILFLKTTVNYFIQEVKSLRVDCSLFSLILSLFFSPSSSAKYHGNCQLPIWLICDTMLTFLISRKGEGVSSGWG